MSANKEQNILVSDVNSGFEKLSLQYLMINPVQTSYKYAIYGSLKECPLFNTAVVM